MTIHVDIARSHATLAELAAQAENGEEIVLSRDGHAVAVIRAATAPETPRFRFGALAHLGPLTDEEANLFLQPDPEFIEAAEAADEDDLYR
jgi:antitoxin (DNA-binding transcriptional repressor) of toxin-antitoxin stability system